MTTTHEKASNWTAGYFLTDVTALTERVRKSMAKGPVSDTCGMNLQLVVEVLNHALAIALVCVLRYKGHYRAVDGVDARSAADEFLELAADEANHADRIAARIQQLGGRPNFSSHTLTGHNRSEGHWSEELEAGICEDLVAEQVAVDAYSEIISWLGDGDPLTRQMLEEILAVEEEHAEDMRDLLSGMNY